MPTPVFIIAFANSADRPLELDKERQRLHAALGGGNEHGQWQLVPSARTSVSDFLDLLQQADYRDRVALLHFAGHADGRSLLMENADGSTDVADAAGLAEFLAQHQGLALVFLNACSTDGQVEALLRAGVPAVIATEHDVDDRVAAEFSERFYKAFVCGQTLREAFATAEGAVRAHRELGERASRSIKGVGGKRPSGDWPWKLRLHPDRPHAGDWSLNVALQDPLWGIPAPPPAELPASPFRHLRPYGREHAAIFFGRRGETRELFDAIAKPGAGRVILFHGVSGAGKSSLLEAGLLPRLEQRRTVVCKRRDASRSLESNLFAALGIGTLPYEEASASVAAAWRAAESADRPLTVILDQVEEALTSADDDGEEQLADLAATLARVFAAHDAPAGNIVLSFRKEYLADVQRRLREAGLPSTDVFLHRLDAPGMTEAIEGVTRDPALRAHFGLTIAPSDPTLAAQIAGDLVKDEGSAIGPALQVVLSRLWEMAIAAEGPPVFRLEMYQAMANDGQLLRSFVTEQLEALGRGALAEASDSGLVLDVLAFHSTDLGDASRSVTVEDRRSRYPEKLWPTVDAILCAAREMSLMVIEPIAGQSPGSVGTTRLGHDTLAPHVRMLASRAIAPVQRAQRVLEERGEDWKSAADGVPKPMATDAPTAVAPRRSRLVRLLLSPFSMLLWLIRIPARTGRLVKRVGWTYPIVAFRMLRDLVSARPRVQEDELGRRTLDAVDLRTVEAGEPWLRRLRPEEAELMAASRAAAHRAVLLRRKVVAAFGVAALALLYAAVHAHQNSNRVLARGALAAAASPAMEPLDRLLLMRELSADDEPLGGVQAAAEIVSLPVPTALLESHSGLVLGAAFSPDGKRALTWSRKANVTVFKASGRGTPLVLTHPKPVVAAGFSPDGACIATVGTDGPVRVWSSTSDSMLAQLDAGGKAQSVRFDRDGRRIIATVGGGGASGRVMVWRMAGTSCLEASRWDLVADYGDRADTRPRVALVQEMANGALVTLTGGATPLQFHDAARLAMPLDAGNGAIDGILASANGYRLAVWGDGQIRILELDPTGVPRLRGVSRLNFPRSTNWRVAISRLGERLAVAPGAEQVYLVGVVLNSGARAPSSQLDFELRDSLPGHNGVLSVVRFSPDGSRLLTAGGDGAARVDFLDDPNQRAPMLLNANVYVRTASFSPGGHQIITVQDSTARVWSDAVPIEPIVARTGVIVSARARPLANGGVLTTGRDGLILLDSAGHRVGMRPIAGGRLFAFEVDAASERVAVAWDDSLAIITLKRGVAVHDWRVKLPNALGFLRPLAFSVGGEWLVVGEAGAVTVFHPGDDLRDTSARRIPLALAAVSAIALHPDSTWLIASDDAGRRMRVRYDSVAVPKALPSAAGRVNAIALEGSHAMLDVTQGSAYALQNGLIELRDEQTADPVSLVRAHSGPILDAAFDPAGERLVTASNDGTARIWKVEEGMLEMTLTGHQGPITSARFTLDGQRVVTASSDGTTRIWEVTWPGLMGRIALKRTTACLSFEKRQRYLGENIPVAGWRWIACDLGFGR